MLLDINDFIHKLDAYTSLLMAVIEYDLVPPSFGTEIQVRGARNLLVEFKRQAFSKLDFDIKLSTTTAVYGSNGSGKSIYLRCLANIQYLAQIGSFVPCKSASLPIFERILTKFTSQEDP